MDMEPKKIESMDDLRAAMNDPEIQAASKEFSKKYLKANRPKSLAVVIFAVTAILLMMGLSNHKASSVTPVALRTAAHLLLSSILWAGVCAVCGWPTVWSGRLALLGLYWFAYAVVWLLRYLSWRAELERIREGLGLVPKPAAGGIFQWRPLRVHLLLAAGAELALPLLLRLADAPDLPVLTGIFYPFLMLPFFCLCTGWSAGRRFGVALLYPVACGLLTVPCVFLLYDSSALFQVWMAAVPALAGNLLGALVKRRKE